MCSVTLTADLARARFYCDRDARMTQGGNDLIDPEEMKGFVGQD